MSKTIFLKKMLRDILNEFKFRNKLKRRNHFNIKVETKANSAYVISSNAGIYTFSCDGFTRVSELDVFGISIVDQDLYVAVAHGDDSVVFKGDAKALYDKNEKFEWKELYRIVGAGHSGRIHQIFAFGDYLWITDTKKNLITKLDRFTGQWKASIGPFVCNFGHPILQDHNHVNGVFVSAEFLVFTAFRINKQSAICLCGDGKVNIFSHRNMGIHDCVFTGEDFWFSDSYRMFEKGKAGVPFKNGKEVDPKYFNEQDANFVRGIAGDNDEVIVGNSFSGSREERFKGQGNLFLLRNEKVIEELVFPGAQIYDILLLETGTHFREPPSVKTYDDAYEKLSSYLGKPVQILELKDILVSEGGIKKFADSDLGDIREYMSRV